MAWKSEVLASVSHLLNRDMVKLQDVWDVIGIQEDKRLERMGPLKMHNERLLGQMIHKEELMKEQLEEAIKNWQGELQTLCSELHLDPYKADESSTLLQLEKELRNKVKALLQEKNGRMEECEMLLKEDQALCTDLCKTPYFLPSRQELEELKNHLVSAAKEKERRLATLFELQSEITQLMADVEYVPDPTFEKDAVLEQENLLVLSDGNIQSLNVLCHQLGMKKQELMATQESLKEQISSLRNRLQIPLEQQNMCATGSICQVNRVLQQELDQLQQMMTKHIKQNVTGIRQELHTYWDKSFYSQKQREEFAFLLDENFTEELLKVHEEELLKITLYYEKHQELFDNIEKWQRWWKLLLECEKKALDPKKYANRGGSLLREVRERSQLNKKLPKLEEELKLCIEKWETEQGCPFLVNGQKFVTCIANQWEQHRLQREQEQCVKQEGGIVCKTLLKRPIGKPDAPHSKIRKLNGPSNFTLVNSGGSTCNQAGKPPLPARKAPKASKLPDQLQRPSLQNDEASQPSTSNSVVTSYSVFLHDSSGKSDPGSAQLNSTTLDNP